MGMHGATPLMGPFHKVTKGTKFWTPLGDEVHRAAANF